MSDDLLPEGSLLLHVGPHKTGTTAVQSAFFTARDDLAGYGVAYPGRSRTPIEAVAAITGRGRMTGDPPTSMRTWRRFAARTRVRGRVVVSNEFLSDADPAAVRRIVDDLGRERVHVVVTLRRLDRIAASQWQQYVQNGSGISWQRWLRGVLGRSKRQRTPSFWRRHRHDVVVRRWADEVGADRVRVVVVDDGDPSALLRTFEAMVGLPAHTLVPEADRQNRSLTWAEAELLRRFNRSFRAGEGDPRDYRRLVRLGAVRALKAAEPPPDAVRPPLPAWALRRLRRRSRRIVRGVRQSGVAVIGDLDALVVPPPGDQAARRISEPPPVTPDLVARAVAGVVEADRDRPERGWRAAARRVVGMRPGDVLDAVRARRYARGGRT
ncbi:hypothetical protein CLV56_1109 [Mumia flava]|uniref:Sulfotransferase family protein n=1 Tax=Mumia flava TaxID=1348852 RepID=A0A2M9BG59_9ACTN|nr:hypothetical protein [Mumia flava]PJJ56894.1 hypothetical protein CLV56_1109 [Mumia flava]